MSAYRDYNQVYQRAEIGRNPWLPDYIGYMGIYDNLLASTKRLGVGLGVRILGVGFPYPQKMGNPQWAS